jgi:small subunit ribosomal protein S20
MRQRMHWPLCPGLGDHYSFLRRLLSTMPNLPSAKKRMRVEEKRRARNKSIKSAVRTQVTKARHAIAAGPEEPETAEAIQLAMSELDRAVSKGVLHRNNAGRRKSRLMARLHKAQEA